MALEALSTTWSRVSEVQRRVSSILSIRSTSLKPVCSDHFNLKPMGISERVMQVKMKLILLWRRPSKEKSLRIAMIFLGFIVGTSRCDVPSTLSSQDGGEEVAEA